MKTMSVLISLLILFVVSTYSQIPKLNSQPSARATIYLDFDGQSVTGTSWNWNGTIDAQPPALSNAAIQEIFNRVAEDFMIFELNITTDSATFLAAPLAKRMRIIVTPTSSWYGRAGGVSYVGSFTWGDDTPAWVFSELLGNNIKYVAEACSHEAGHTLGLQHQSSYDATCKKIAEYASGQGTGEIGWAPIMGVGYYKNLTTWHDGKSAIGCNYLQNDISTIATLNGFGLRADDYADSHIEASEIQFSGNDFSVNGIINSSIDHDVFKIVLERSLNLRMAAVPQNVGSANSGADVDISLSLLNNEADTIGQYNPSNLLNAGVDTNLTSGTYYLVVEGVGNANLTDYGSLGNYVLSGQLNSSLAVHHLTLRGWVSAKQHLLQWTFKADEAFKDFELQESEDGISFHVLATIDPLQHSFTFEPVPYQKIYYRVKAITLAEETGYYSNIISLQTAKKNYGIVSWNNPGNTIQISSSGNYDFRLMLQNGQLITTGKISKGINTIAVPGNVKGLLLLRIVNANEAWIEKILKQ